MQLHVKPEKTQYTLSAGIAIPPALVIKFGPILREVTEAGKWLNPSTCPSLLPFHCDLNKAPRDSPTPKPARICKLSMTANAAGENNRLRCLNLIHHQLTKPRMKLPNPTKILETPEKCEAAEIGRGGGEKFLRPSELLRIRTPLERKSVIRSRFSSLRPGKTPVPFLVGYFFNFSFAFRSAESFISVLVGKLQNVVGWDL